MAFYTVMLDQMLQRKIIVYKASDTAVWIRSSSILMDNTVRSMWIHQDGTDLHIATQETTSHRVAYHKYSTSSDTFTISNEEVVNPVTKLGDVASAAVSLSVRSDGDVIILFAQRTGSFDGVRYARREAAVWTLVSLDVSQALVAGVVVRGASDRMHFLWRNPGNADMRHRSLASDNTLDTEASADASAGSGGHIWGRGVSYVSGSDTIVKIPYRDSNNMISQVRLISGANPTINIDANVSDGTTGVSGVQALLGNLSLNSTTTYLLYVDSTFDIFRDSQTDGGSYGTDTEVVDAITSGGVSANIYDHSGIKLAFISRESTTNYREVSL
jgi:hypothetical protein